MTLEYCASCGEWGDRSETCVGCGAFEANGPTPDYLSEDYERVALGYPRTTDEVTLPDESEAWPV